MLKLKLQYFGHLMRRTDIGKDSDAGRDWGQEEKGTTEDELVGWHHRLDGHEFEQALEVGNGQGGLMCCSPWGCKELDTTEWLNWLTVLNHWGEKKETLKLFTLAHSFYMIEPQSTLLTSLARIFLLVHEIPATLSTSTSHVYSPFRASALDDPSSGNNFLGSPSGWLLLHLWFFFSSSHLLGMPSLIVFLKEFLLPLPLLCILSSCLIFFSFLHSTYHYLLHSIYH